MAKYLRPRRGTAITAVSQNMLLKSGELFLEIPDGTSLGKTPGRLVVGDGTTPYPSINYSSTAATFKPFITDPSLYTPVFTNSTYATSNWTVSAATASIDKIGDGTGSVGLPTIIGAVKETLCKHEDSIHKLNNDMGGINTSISNLNTTASILQTSVSNLNTTCSNLISTSTNLASSVSNLATSVSSMGGGIVGTDFRMKNLTFVDPNCYKAASEGGANLGTFASTAEFNQFMTDNGFGNRYYGSDLPEIYNEVATNLKLGQYFILNDGTTNYGAFYIVDFGVTSYDYRPYMTVIGRVRNVQYNTTDTTVGGYHNSNISKYIDKTYGAYDTSVGYILSNKFFGSRTCGTSDHYYTKAMSTAVESMAGTGLMGATTDQDRKSSNYLYYCGLCTVNNLFGYNPIASSYYDNNSVFDNKWFSLFKYIFPQTVLGLASPTNGNQIIFKDIVSSTEVASLYSEYTSGYQGRIMPLKASTIGMGLIYCNLY